MIFGAILLAFGLIYLMKQENSLNRLINIVNEDVLENEVIYQQSNEQNMNLVSEETLYAIVMGYREYPITIDRTIIETDGTDYENYFTLIKEGYYQKIYEYDDYHNIKQVNYIYTGA
jgi:hypothetical protein